MNEKEFDAMAGDVGRLDLRVVEQIRQLGEARPGLMANLVALFDRNTETMLDEAPARIAADAREEVRITFHSLKGTAASLGARRLGELAGVMESASADGASQARQMELLASIRDEFAAVRVVLARMAAQSD